VLDEGKQKHIWAKINTPVNPNTAKWI